MKRILKYRVSVADSMVLIGIGLAASYWVLESIYNLFTTNEIDFFRQLVGSDIHEIWPRVIVLCLFVFFGSHVKYTIDNRKKAEEALKESEEKYRTILESINEGYFEVDISGKFSYFNDTALNILNRSGSNVLGLSFSDFATSTHETDAFDHAYERIYRTQQPAHITEYELASADGTHRIIDASVSLMKDSRGNAVGFRGLFRDVTERLQAERERQQLESQLQEARAATILGLAKLAEYRDKGTGSHLERIREYARIIAVEFANHPEYRDTITDEYINDIFHSAILHDIGKVGVPDAILTKPDRLTPQEFEMVKQHAVLGGDVLDAIDSQIEGKSFLTMGKEIAYYHHEKWDGTGYPEGLKGAQIPLSARFVALADVYDALTSRRFYKEAYPHETARETIRQLKGRHFDPDVVDAFLIHERRFQKICQRFKDSEELVAEPADYCPAMASC